ncbi:hypothetical protein AN5431.2 [Paecilomyces variotii No. 5]|uniref:Xylanolytic transcriptional activator regulatory domain-containing protein n=1 Tax=Byssochlamys spectabilis (strain No. 5 / NBRC 109023) TaxID=1356009 RepID=V5FBV5_BYSSN|nr:hypothetical protein AN5431.2 [Paecilomyces variotii No. 5]
MKSLNVLSQGRESKPAIAVRTCTYHRMEEDLNTDDSDGASYALYNGEELTNDTADASSSNSTFDHREKQKTSVEDSAQADHLSSAIYRMRNRLVFLRNFTQATGLNQAYNYNRTFLQKTPDICSFDIFETELYSTEKEQLMPNPWSYFLGEVETGLDNYHELGGINSPPSQVETSNDPVLVKASQIWDLFRPIIEKSSDRSISMFDVINFFSPENLSRYLPLFWDRWYPHCPIIHRPTFDIMTCPPLLLLSMALIGSLTSSDELGHQHVKLFLDMAEDLIFSHSIFSDSFVSNGEGFHSSEISILQATYFISVMQKWEGTRTSKLRIQRSRFTTFVAAIRAIGLSRATHGGVAITPDFGTDSWQEYIRKEEMIRTFTYAFLLDSAFVIFHNSVPRMVLQEMAVDLTCPEELFQASSVVEFISEAMSHPKMCETTPLLMTCIRHLCAETPDLEIIRYLNSASTLNMFTIATAIHGLIFHQKMSFTPMPLATGPLSIALSRWEIAWKSILERLAHSPTSTQLWTKGGFTQHADEFACLARIHLERANISSEKWNKLMQNLPKPLSQSTNDGIATFDQTNMDHVANLILAVELLNLNA